jgi:hypothetical protein
MVAMSPGWQFSQTRVWMAVAIVALCEGLALSVGARIYQQVESDGENPNRRIQELPLSGLATSCWFCW